MTEFAAANPDSGAKPAALESGRRTPGPSRPVRAGTGPGRPCGRCPPSRLPSRYAIRDGTAGGGILTPAPGPHGPRRGRRAGAPRPGHPAAHPAAAGPRGCPRRVRPQCRPGPVRHPDRRPGRDRDEGARTGPPERGGRQPGRAGRRYLRPRGNARAHRPGPAAHLGPAPVTRRHRSGGARHRRQRRAAGDRLLAGERRPPTSGSSTGAWSPRTTPASARCCA